MEIIAKFFNGVAAPFITCKMFGRDVYLLIDTGSNQNLIDRTFLANQRYDGQIYKIADCMMTGNGEVENSESIETVATIGGKDYTVQMVLVDYSNVFAVFDLFLGKKPVGILGIDFLVKYGMVLDFKKWCMLKSVYSKDKR